MSAKRNFFLIFAVASITYLGYQELSFSDPEVLARSALNSTHIAKKVNDFAVDLVAKPACSRFPSLADLNVSDTYWQVLTTSNGTFYLYNAYYDDREAVTANGSSPVVRILALIDRIDPTVNVSCQLWFEGVREPLESDVYEYRMLWNRNWGLNREGASPYLLSCRNAHEHALAPRFVSLSEKPCTTRLNNALDVKNRRPADGRRRHFVVSVKPLDFGADIALQLVEWCEMLKIFGVDRIEVFVVRAHPNTQLVLDFYQGAGLVTVKRLQFPRNLPNERAQSWHQWSQNDLIAYHDSFYENLRLFEYMLPLDADEVVVPTRAGERTWRELLMRTLSRAGENRDQIDAFPCTNQYFLLKSAHENETVEGIPRKLRFLSNIYRAANFTPNGGNAKTFMRMDRVLAVHNHFPLSCVGTSESCRLFGVDFADGHLFHYRDDCFTEECLRSKNSPEVDTTLWRFKNQILSGVFEAIRRMKAQKGDIGEIFLS